MLSKYISCYTGNGKGVYYGNFKIGITLKYYGVHTNITKAVDGISFPYDEGEFVAIMGHLVLVRQHFSIVFQQSIVVLLDISMLVTRILQN